MGRIDDAVNGRFYELEGAYLKSVTNALQVVSHGDRFDRWLGDSGSYDEAIAKRDAAGARGTAIHEAIALLLSGCETIYVDEWEPRAIKQLQGFVNWFEETQPVLLASEVFVYSRTYKYAGTADIVYEMHGANWLLDFKSSSAVYPTHHMQVASYAHAWNENEESQTGVHIDRMGVLLLNPRTKKGWQLVETVHPDTEFIAFLNALALSNHLYGNEPQFSTKDPLPRSFHLETE
jgi:hypothetical protein